MNTSTSDLNASNETTGCVYSDDKYAEIKLVNFNLTVSIALFGLVCNSMVIAVNRWIRKPTSTDVYVAFLAVTDNLLITVLMLHGFRYAYRFLMDPHRVYWITSGIIAMVAKIFGQFVQCLNTYTIVLLNIDRYIQVKFPSASKKWSTPHRAGIHIGILSLIAMMFCLPRMIEMTTLLLYWKETIDPCDGFFLPIYGLAIDPTYKLAYSIIVYIAVLYAIPLTTLTITNITIMRQLAQRRQWLNSLQPEARKSNETSLKKKEMNAMVTLISVTLIFMVCQIPTIVTQVLWKVSRKHAITSSMFSPQVTVINSSVNFIVYAVSSKQFRRRVKEILKKQNKVESSVY